MAPYLLFLCLHCLEDFFVLELKYSSKLLKHLLELLFLRFKLLLFFGTLESVNLFQLDKFLAQLDHLLDFTLIFVFYVISLWV
jgi:hypothetical protein